MAHGSRCPRVTGGARRAGRGAALGCRIGLPRIVRRRVKPMSADGLRLAQEKMRGAGVADSAIDVFSHYYGLLESGATGLIAEDSIEPLLDPPALADVVVDPEQAREALARTVLIKLNGGLGTSMGMDRAKSLLPVRDGMSFLDVLVGQVRAAREAHDVPLPLILMNSFRTREQSLEALAAHPDIAVEGLPAGLPAEPGAQAARRRPDAGRMAGGPDPGVVPAGPRRPVHRDPVLRGPGGPARPRLPLRQHLERGQPRCRTERDPGRVVRGAPEPRTPPSSAAGLPPTARAGTWRSAGPTGD